MSKENQEKEEIKQEESIETETKESNEKVSSEIEDLIKLVKITQADFENYKKRIEKERQELQTHLKKDIITKLLPVLDLFEMSMQYKDNAKEFVNGMEMTHKQFLEVLQKEGVKEIPTDKFDTTLHEAIAIEEGPNNKILQVLQKGYTINNTVIRCTRVKVGKEAKNE